LFGLPTPRKTYSTLHTIQYGQTFANQIAGYKRENDHINMAIKAINLGVKLGAHGVRILMAPFVRENLTACLSAYHFLSNRPLKNCPNGVR
jgi:hypothetical protein